MKKMDGEFWGSVALLCVFLYLMFQMFRLITILEL